MSRNLKVVVLGGCGSIGGEIVKQLIERKYFTSITIADKKLEKSEDILKKCEPDRIKFTKMNSEDYSSIMNTINGTGVVINAAGPYTKYGIKTVKAAIESGVNYIDINDEVGPTEELFQSDTINKSARKKNICVLIGMGASPGITNIIAKYGSSKMDKVNSVHIASVIQSKARGQAIFYHRLNIFRKNAIAYKEGKWKRVSPFNEKETKILQCSFGEAKCYTIAHPEPITIPRFLKGIKNVSIKLGYPKNLMSEMLKILIKYGLSSEKAITVNDKTMKPIDFTSAYLASKQADKIFKFSKNIPLTLRQIQVSGQYQSKEVELLYTLQLESTVPATAMPSVKAAELISKKEIREKGLLAPEALDPFPFLAELNSMGAKMQVTRQETSANITI